MKRAIIYLVLAAVALFSLSSCATILSQSPSPINTEVRVNLDQANFKVVGTVEGISTSRYICGFGGPGKGDAISQMYENANLTGAQKIIDVAVAQKVKTVFGVLIIIEYKAMGIIVEFTE